MRHKMLLVVTAAVVFLGLAASPSAAHTDADLIAVPAGAEAVVKLKPTHGCDGSPTTEVAIQAPVEGAAAIDVDGWTATSTADGKGNTVLEWKGGSLPSDQTGEFPIEFIAPDTPGELLTFPSVQTCESGDELSWISGDPEAEFPAPRILILPAGAEAAGAIDEVPADAPGRDQLSQIVDIDNPDAPAASTTTEAAATETTTEQATTPTTAGPTEGQEAAPAEAPSDDDEDEDDNTGLWIAILVAVGVGGGVAGGSYYRSKKTDDEG